MQKSPGCVRAGAAYGGIVPIARALSTEGLGCRPTDPSALTGRRSHATLGSFTLGSNALRFHR